MKSIALLGVLSLAACATDRAAFRPTDNVTASGHGGQPAAAYEVRREAGEDPSIQIHVWSRGAYLENDRTFARLAIEVRNTGEGSVTLEPGELRLEAYRNEGARLPPAQLVRTIAPGGSVTVPPGEARTIQLVFAFPYAIAPDAIGSLRLRWALWDDDDRRYVQFTDFRRVREYVATGITYYDPLYGFYDPFFYGPPYSYGWRYYHLPVRRVIVEPRDRGVREVRRVR